LVADNNVKRPYHRLFTAKEKYGIFGVVLQPYAIPILFGILSTEIKNELTGLPSLTIYTRMIKPASFEDKYHD
jgi:hypothetical protein